MDKREKLETMDKLLRQFEDIKNSETAVLKKITQIEAENINEGITLLDKYLPDLHENSDNIVERVDTVITEFTEYRDKYAKDNKLEEPEEAPTN